MSCGVLWWIFWFDGFCLGFYWDFPAILDAEKCGHLVVFGVVEADRRKVGLSAPVRQTRQKRVMESPDMDVLLIVGPFFLEQH